MGIEERLREASSQRRDLEKQELRQSIMDAAAEVFLEQGQGHFSLRQVAERIGYSPATIYHYFENKNDLLFHVIDEGYLIFKRQFLAAAATQKDPLQRLVALGRAYVSFGKEHPHYYQVIFMRRSDFLMRSRTGEELPRAATFEVVRQAVQEAMDQGLLKKDDPESYSDAFWAWMHGLVALSFSMPIFDEARTQRAMLALEKFILQGLHPH